MAHIGSVQAAKFRELLLCPAAFGPQIPDTAAKGTLNKFDMCRFYNGDDPSLRGPSSNLWAREIKLPTL